MAIKFVGVGSATNDGTGDNIRVGGQKINNNFSEIYTTFGSGTALTLHNTAAANTYVNAQIGGTNTAIRALVSDRMQVANTKAVGVSSAIYVNANTTSTFTRPDATTFQLQHGPSTVSQFTVTNNGSAAYRFSPYGYDGNDNPNIFAISGTTIAINIGLGGAHPFAIQEQSGSNYNTGLMHVSTTGVVTTEAAAQGKTSGTLYWRIPENISGNYRYQCTSHAAMRGNVCIKAIASI
tara:strand:- start:959 stop:1666 length:708 start_codon:yes stop_codon:yes gene_type:complete